MPGPLESKVYVGNLGSDASREELEDVFSYYGRLRNVWVARNPPGFAFVEFEDFRDAEDAVRGLNGRSICGRRARIELSAGKSRGGGGGGGGASGGSSAGGGRFTRGMPMRRGGGRPFNPDDKCYKCGERGHYARDCRETSSRPSRYSRSRSRSRSPRRRQYSKSRSRSASRGRSRERSKSASRDRSGSRDRSPPRGRSRSGSPRPNPRDESRSPDGGRSRSRSRSIENGDN